MGSRSRSRRRTGRSADASAPIHTRPSPAGRSHASTASPSDVVVPASTPSRCSQRTSTPGGPASGCSSPASATSISDEPGRVGRQTTEPAPQRREGRLVAAEQVPVARLGLQRGPRAVHPQRPARVLDPAAREAGPVADEVDLDLVAVHRAQRVLPVRPRPARRRRDEPAGPDLRGVGLPPGSRGKKSFAWSVGPATGSEATPPAVVARKRTRRIRGVTSHAPTTSTRTGSTSWATCVRTGALRTTMSITLTAGVHPLSQARNPHATPVGQHRRP